MVGTWTGRGKALFVVGAILTVSVTTHAQGTFEEDVPGYELHVKQRNEEWEKQVKAKFQAEEKQRRVENALSAIVMVAGNLSDSPTFGAGIIVGRDKELLYVATANHVLRRGNIEAKDLRVTFKWSKQPLEAKLLKPFDTDLDLAVLGIPNVDKRVSVCSEWFMELAETPVMKRGDLVFPAGNPHGESWLLPVTPDTIAQISQDRIKFQSTVLSIGHSGGALITDEGHLAGLIVSAETPFGTAVSMPKVLQTLRKWSVPVQLNYVGQPGGLPRTRLATQCGVETRTR